MNPMLRQKGRHVYTGGGGEGKTPCPVCYQCSAMVDLVHTRPLSVKPPTTYELSCEVKVIFEKRKKVKKRKIVVSKWFINRRFDHL